MSNNNSQGGNNGSKPPKKAGKKSKKPAEAIYTAADRSGFSDADAQYIGPILDKIIKRDGGIDKDKLYAEVKARHGTENPHPLDKYYEWNDSTAADMWRLDYTGKIIRSVMITYKRNDEDWDSSCSSNVRAYHVVTRNYSKEEDKAPEPHRVYVGIPEIANDDALCEQVMEQVYRLLAQARNKVEAYETIFPAQMANFQNVVAAINALNNNSPGPQP